LKDVLVHGMLANRAGAPKGWLQGILRDELKADTD